MRRGLLIALLFLIAAAPAAADPRPLTRLAGPAELALAGEVVLVSSGDQARVHVEAVPLGGGPARAVFSFAAPAGMRIERTRLDASAQKGALAVELVRSVRDNTGSTLVFAGPAGGGWSALAPFDDPLAREDPLSVFALQVDGERVITSETRGSYGDLRVVVRDPEPHEIAFTEPEDEAQYVVVAGDVVASRARAAGESAEDRSPGNVLLVRNWRTGAVLTSADLRGDIGSIALRPDGRAAASTEQGGLYDVAPGAAPRRLARRGGAPAWAGDSLVHRSGDGLRVVDPGGRVRRLGAPTASLSGFAADGTRVVWEANGCLLVDDLGAPPAAAPGPGPCPRSELDLAAQTGPRLARTLPIRLRCVAAPRGCRGTLRLSTVDAETLKRPRAVSRPVRFSIPAGTTSRVRVPLTDRGFRSLRREVEGAEAPDSAVVLVDARTRDGDRVVDAPLTVRPPERDDAPTGSPAAVQRVYADYLQDGTISRCAHAKRTLERTLATLEPEFAARYPDFREALETLIERSTVCP